MVSNSFTVDAYAAAALQHKTIIMNGRFLHESDLRQGKNQRPIFSSNDGSSSAKRLRDVLQRCSVNVEGE